MSGSATISQTRLFNRAAAASALLFALAAQLVRPATSYQDFSQYYMGALMARAGLWDSIYPRPLPGSIYNAGWGDQSAVREAYRAMGERHGINEFGFRFIQSPPVAVLFIPLTLLEHPTACRLWIAFLSLCVWGVALQAARVYTIARGREDMGAGVVILLIACSVLAYRAIRVGNVSPLVGLCIGMIVLDLVRPRASAPHSVLAGAAMTIGTLAKYATPVLAPVYVFMNRWAALLWSGAFMLFIVAGTWALSGSAPFIEFANSIAPTLGRSHPHRANQSVEGLILRTTNHATLPPRWAIPVRAAQTATVVLLLWLIWRRRDQLARHPPLVCAAAASLICWLLIFGPLYWEHYPVYLCPLWGWLAWEARLSMPRMILVVAAIALTWVPVPAIPGVRLPEPVNSHILASTVIILGLATARLAGARDSEPTET
jgi:hypothetical protein